MAESRHALKEYRLLERALLGIREDGYPESEEDAVLDEMDRVWEKLTPEERRVLEREGPQCWPRGRG